MEEGVIPKRNSAGGRMLIEISGSGVMGDVWLVYDWK